MGLRLVDGRAVGGEGATVEQSDWSISFEGRKAWCGLATVVSGWKYRCVRWAHFFDLLGVVEKREREREREREGGGRRKELSSYSFSLVHFRSSIDIIAGSSTYAFGHSFGIGDRRRCSTIPNT